MQVDYLIPPMAPAGTPGVVLTIGGTSFSPRATAFWNGAALPTTYVSPTQLRATVDGSLMAQPGSVRVAVSSGSQGSTATFILTNPDPSIGSLLPPSALVGSGAFTLLVTGVNFVPQSRLAWNGQALQTTFISRTQLSATVSADALAAAAFVGVTVANPDPDAAISGRALFPVMNRAPHALALTPASAITGSAELTLDVSGTDFVPESQIAWNGKLRETTFVSDQLLRTTVAATELSASVEVTVAVVSPRPGGGSSGELKFPILNPAPGITEFGPRTMPAGGPGFTLTVTGSGFRSTSIVLWNGDERPTTAASDSLLHAQIPAADIASAGTAVIAVSNPPLGGGTAAEPTPFATAIGSSPNRQAVAYHQDAARSGRVVFGQPLAFPASPSWSVDLGAAVSYPVIADGKAFVVTEGTSAGERGTQLHALDLATGATSWGPVDIPSSFSRAGHAYEAGRLFVLSFDGSLQAFDAATGAPGFVTSLTTARPGDFEAPPAVIDGVVYVGWAGTLFAVDAASGERRWTSNFSSTTAPVAIANDGAYVSFVCEEYKFDLLTGSTVWRHASCSGGGGYTAAYANGLMYVREFGITIYDAVTGAKTGRYDSANLLTVPAVSADALFVVDGGRLKSVGSRGQTTNWDIGFLAPLVSEPISIDTVVVAVSGDGTVHAVDATSGTEVWTGSAGAAVSPPNEGDYSTPLRGISAGEGYLLVPAGHLLTAWRLTAP